MTLLQLIRRNLHYYARTHIGVVAGAFLAAMVLSGALITGDSLHHSLQELTRFRVGKARFITVSSSRFFRADLAERLGTALGSESAALLQSRGLCQVPAGADNVVNARVFGVSPAFWALAPEKTAEPDWSEGGVAINRRLAAQLQLSEGDELVLRTQPVRQLSRELTLAGDTPELTARRVKILRVLDSPSFGRFSLHKQQTAPAAVFMPLARLSRQLEIPGRANLILSAQNSKASLDVETLRQKLRDVYRIEDAELELADLGDSFQLQSKRIFLNESVELAAMQAGTNPSRYLSYFVHSIMSAAGEEYTPFVFVTATDDPALTRGLRDGEAVLSDWIAKDQGVSVGTLMHMRYLRPARADDLEAKETSFLVKRVISQDSPRLDPQLTPPFPGLTGVENCSDWSPGIPLDLGQLRPKDETYWDQYAATPRVLFNLAFGKELWANRFGRITAVRFSADENSAAAIRDSLRKQLAPETLGIQSRATVDESADEGSNAVNFTQLFLGLSFFLIAAALLLLSLLFIFTVEQRSRQIGIFRALGFTPRRIRALIRREGMILALIGILPGTLAGVLYTMGILAGLSTVWQDAVGTRQLTAHIRWQSLAWGAGISALLSWLILSHCARQRSSTPQLINLLHHEGVPDFRLKNRSPMPAYLLALLLAVAALLVPSLLGISAAGGMDASTSFLLSGALTLLAGFAVAYGQLIRLARRNFGLGISVRRMGWRNTARHPWRSMATVMMLGCGLFLVLAIGGNRRLAPDSPYARHSGSGGFTLYGESALPLDLGSQNPAAPGDGETHSRRWRQETRRIALLARGVEEANCLNLQRVTTPRLLGVPPGILARRGSFRFLQTQPPPKQKMPIRNDDSGEDASLEQGISGRNSPWHYLSADYGENIVPGIADQATLQWGLNKQLGDKISYSDEEGRRFQVKIVGVLENSILQGSILVDRAALRQRFTRSAAARVLLVDVPVQQRDQARSQLLQLYADRGLTLVSTRQRMQGFLNVQNTYLSIFLVLGGLGVLVGTAGLGIVIFRNAAERLREFAILRASGFSRARVRAMLIWEHIFLAAVAILIAVAASAAGMIPPLLLGGNRIPWFATAIILGVIVVASLGWILFAASRSVRGDLLADLRHE